MTRLSQIIAIKKDVHTRYEQIAFTAYKGLQKPEPLIGILKTYQPIEDEEVERRPSQYQPVQNTVEATLADIGKVGARLIDVIAAQEKTNQKAVANVVVDGQVFIEDAPVTLLLALERILAEELEQAKKLPTLPLDMEWEDPEDGIAKSVPIHTISTKQVYRNHVKAPATDKHPAQVETYSENVKAGTWTTRHLSGMIPVRRKREIIDRTITLLEAVKQAREEANGGTTVVDLPVGSKVYDYIHGGGRS